MDLTRCVADPDPGIRGLFDPWIQDPGSGMGKKSRSKSGIQIRDKHRISESLEKIFWVKILEFFLMRIRIWDSF